MVRTAADGPVDAARPEEAAPVPVTAPAPSGPSATAAWIDREVAGIGGPAVTVGILPDASNQQREAAGAPGAFHTLLRRPALWRDGSGVPVLSLTLLLSRAPSPGDETVAPLVEQGILAFDVRLSAPPDAQSALGAPYQDCRAIFGRTGAIDLIWTEAGGERPVNAASPSGIVLRAGLSARLTRAQTLDVLSALAGGESAFRVRGRVEFRAIDPDTTIIVPRTLDFDVGLDEVIGGALRGSDPERHIHLVSPGATPGSGPGPAPVRVRSAPPAVRAAAAAQERFTVVDGGVKSLTVAMQPAGIAMASPAALAASDIAKPVALATVAGRPQHWLVDNAVVEVASASQARSLPIVENADAAIWRDRVTSNKYWYAPAVELVTPDPAGDAQSSPFTFTFTRTGATSTGTTALAGTVRLSLRRAMSAATRAALQPLAGAQAQEVPQLNIAISLVIPYISDGDGRLKTTTVRGRISTSGDTWTVTFDLLNEWVRLCYGSLSQAGFQAQAAQAEATWSFNAYVPIKQQQLEVVAGAKAARPPAALASHAVLMAQPAVGIRPQMHTNPAVLDALRRTRYAMKTIVRQARLDVLLPCDRFGAFYLESSSTGTTAVGCVDALRLGHATLRQYAEMPELASSTYRVFRSLQQPGRFLLLPEAYRVTRYAASAAEKAYRPAIAVYSALDAANPANNRVVFHATLQPDVPAHERRSLRTRLLAHARDPQIEYPTEIPADCSYVWTLGSGASVDPRVLKTPDGFQVTLATDLAGALLVRTMLQTAGVSGTAAFQLPDGTRLQTLLSVDLRDVIGPWDTGPIEISAASGRARLTNRIERPVEVSDLLIFPPLEGQEVAVERLIPPGGVHEMNVPGGAAELFALSTQPSVGPVVLEEIRSFVEDIHTSIVFLDLINHANHGLRELQVEARLKDVPGLNTLRLTGDPPSATTEFILPLTTFLASRTLQFRVTKTFTASAPQVTRWLDWDLDRNGNVVSLTWELVA